MVATGFETVDDTVAGGRPLEGVTGEGPALDRPFLPFVPLDRVSTTHSSLGMSATLVKNT